MLEAIPNPRSTCMRVITSPPGLNTTEKVSKYIPQESKCSHLLSLFVRGQYKCNLIPIQPRNLHPGPE